MNTFTGMATAETHSHPIRIFLIFLKLGLTSFGGPIAHLEYFRQEFVFRRKWLNAHAYVDLVSLCQFLPGPASSQVGIALGLSRGGIPGAIAAFLGFTLPSVIFLILCGFGLSAVGGNAWMLAGIHGLKIVAVAIVAQALWSMGRLLGRDTLRIAIALGAAIISVLFSTAWSQIILIVAGDLVGIFLLKSAKGIPTVPIPVAVSRMGGVASLALFFLLLIGLPLMATSQTYAVKLFDAFYRAGALVFGGGHVVLPLLQSQVVPPGWVSSGVFMTGYGLAQAVPGPLFTFAAYLGAVSTQSPRGWGGAAIAVGAIFLPAFLLIVGIFPFWEQLRKHSLMQRAMLGINAVVVGLLLAALYNPVWTSGIKSIVDLALAAFALLLLMVGQWPSWAVVIITVTIAVIVG